MEKFNRLLLTTIRNNVVVNIATHNHPAHGNNTIGNSFGKRNHVGRYTKTIGTEVCA